MADSELQKKGIYVSSFPMHVYDGHLVRIEGSSKEMWGFEDAWMSPEAMSIHCFRYVSKGPTGFL